MNTVLSLSNKTTSSQETLKQKFVRLSTADTNLPKLFFFGLTRPCSSGHRLRPPSDAELVVVLVAALQY